MSLGARRLARALCQKQQQVNEAEVSDSNEGNAVEEPVLSIKPRDMVS
jgi:hypothetical protein